MAGRRDPWVRWFDVTNPRKHSRGYTIYKVTSKVFPVHSPEATTEIVVWKRYNDISKLHKTLSLLHRNLHRPGVFPDFPKPRIFGRFDDVIVEERRLAAIELLNFIGSQAHLFNSLAVQEFFETTESSEGEKPTQDQNILQPVSLTPNSELEGESGTQEGEEPRQEGAEPEEGEVTRVRETTRQPSVDDSAADHPTESPSLTREADESASLGSAAGDGLIESLSGIWAHRHPENSDSELSDADADAAPTNLPGDQSQPRFILGDDQQVETRSEIVSEFDPFGGESSSSPRQVASTSNSQLLSECVSSSPDQSADSMQSHDEVDSGLTPPSDTLGEYIQSKEDYLYKAVKQIRRARKEEGETHYQIAFDYYKRAVALLLTGVQGDGDEGRRSVVKRKTAEYLVYAEQLHVKYLDSSGTDSDRWRQLHVPRSVARLRAGLSDLANYKVLGLVGGNMLVLDKRSEETFLIKVLQKNAEVTESSWSKQVIPTKCVHMIKLLHYFETESTIYLLLEYAQGGTLWQYTYNYLQGCMAEMSPVPLLPEGAENIYSGKKYPTSPEPPTAATAATAAEPCVVRSDTNVVEEQSKAKEEACSQEYIDMLLGVEPANTEQETTKDTHEAETVADSVNAKDQSLSDKPLPGSKETSPADDVFTSREGSQGELSPREKPEQSSSTRRMSLRRSNSSMSRSVSVERASDTVSSGRHRNWSTAFADLEVSGSRNQTKPHLPENCVQLWAAELLVAIGELHQAGLILRDLRPENILLNSRGHIVLTYFCRWPGVRQEVPTKSVDNLHVSPEGTLPGALCLASDYWSFGVILYELLSGVSLSSAHPEGITSHTILRTPEHLSTEAEHLLKQLLRYNWRERLGGGAAGIGEIKAHPFFSNIDWSSI